MGLLTTGFTKSSSCSRIAGVKTIYAADRTDVVSFTKTSASDAYATVTMTSAGVWRKYEFKENDAELTEALEGQDGAFQWTQQINFNMPGLSKTIQKIKKDFASASGCGMILVVELLNGVNFVIGYSETGGFLFPAKLTESDSTSGRAMTDNPGATISIAAMSPEPMWTFTGTISAT
jgi:hypothetical protein